MSHTRILYLDVVKALAITLVCIGHAPQLVTMCEPSVLIEWIYSFHMPLFMLMCGFFSMHAMTQPFKPFVIRKAKQLLIPVVSIAILITILRVLMGERGIAAIARDEIIGEMWFLKTLFVCYVYVWIVIKIYHKMLDKSGRHSDIALLFTALLSIVLALVFPHGYFLQFNWMLLFFWTGFFLKKYYDRYERNRTIITIIAAIAFILLGRHLHPILLTYSNMLHEPLVILWQFVTALCASLAILGGAELLCRHCHGRVIQWFGKLGTTTLGIYGLQSIVLQQICLHYIHLNLTTLPQWFSDFVIVPVIGIVATLVCYWLVLLLRRNHWANVLLLGGMKTRKA